MNNSDNIITLTSVGILSAGISYIFTNNIIGNYIFSIGKDLNNIKNNDINLRHTIKVLERRVDELEKFRLIAYEKNLSMREQREWDNLSSDYDDDNLD